jgi:hypothetical protein
MHTCLVSWMFGSKRMRACMQMVLGDASWFLVFYQTVSCQRCLLIMGSPSNGVAVHRMIAFHAAPAPPLPTLSCVTLPGMGRNLQSDENPQCSHHHDNRIITRKESPSTTLVSRGGFGISGNLSVYRFCNAAVVLVMLCMFYFFCSISL